MSSTIGPTFVGGTNFTPAGAGTPQPVAPKLHAGPIDALTSDNLGVTTVKKGVAIGEVSEAVSASIQSSFPLDDLSKIATDGRWAQGFRLDSGTLRLMWLSVRRTQEKDGTGGFEIFFQTHGPAVDRFKKRLEDQGAKQGNFNFEASNVDPSAGPGKSILKKTGATWSPSGNNALNLSQDGKWSVDFCPGQPEAIKGAFRIRVFGGDQDATKALQDVVNKLGMHSLFSPPSPNALEKFKLFRLLWQVAPDAADKLRWKSLDEIPKSLEDALERLKLDPHGPELNAIDKADLSNEKIAKRVNLATLLFSKSPKAFLDWAKSDSYSQNGILPSNASYDTESGLNNALNKVGAGTATDEYKAAVAKGAPDPEQSKILLELGLVAKKDFTAAEELLGRDVEAIKLDHLRKVLDEAGIDPLGDRVKNLRFEEVYPGYFTVVDPALPEILKEAGARYLYSTSDNPERVFQQLSGGQKSSLTRFQEGILIQGKSSASDFGTGGAFSVFTRLVTDSVIQKAKKTAGVGYDTKFNDWGGSRPYKLILNRKILERTDWYGYNGDNFGRSTGLTKDNKASNVVRTINEKYSSSNELMFPVGNDSAYVDFVVCTTEDQRTKLIDYLKGQGWTEFNGKPLEKFVRVEPKFFQHPDDMSLMQAVRDAVEKNGFAEALKAAEEAAKTAGQTAVDTAAEQAAKAAAAEQALTTGKQRAEQSAKTPAQQAATKAVNGDPQAAEKLGLDKAKEAAAKAAAETVKTAAKVSLEQIENYSTYSLESAAKTAIQSQATAQIGEAVKNLAEKLIAEMPPPAADTPEARAELKKQIDQAIADAVRPLVSQLLQSAGLEAARTKAEAMVAGDGVSNARYAAESAAREAAEKAASGAVDAAALAALEALAAGPAKTAAAEAIQKTIATSGAGWISSNVRQAAQAAAEKAALEASVTAATGTAEEKAGALLAQIAEAAAKEFIAEYPDKVSAEDKAQTLSSAKEALAELAKTAAERVAKQLAPGAAQKFSDAAAKDAIAAATQTIVEDVASSTASVAAKQAALAPVRKVAQDALTETLLPTAKALAEELKVEIGEKLAQATIAKLEPQLATTWINWAISQQSANAVKALMAKTT